MLQLALVVLVARVSWCVAGPLPARTVSWRHIERDAATILTISESTRSSVTAKKWQALSKDLWVSLVLQRSPNQKNFSLKKYDEITKNDFVTACKVTFNVPKFAVPTKVVNKNCLDVGGEAADCRKMVDSLWLAHKDKKFEPWCSTVFDFFAKRTEPKCPDKCRALFCVPRCDVQDKVKDIDVMEEALEYKINQTTTRYKNLEAPEAEKKKLITAFNKSKVVPLFDILEKAKKSEAAAEAELTKAAKTLVEAKKTDEAGEKEKDVANSKRKSLDELIEKSNKAVQESAAAEREEKILKEQLSEVKETVEKAELVKTSRSKTLEDMKSSLASTKKKVSDSEKALDKVDKSDLEDLDGLVGKKVKAESAAFEKVTKAETAAADHKRKLETLGRSLDTAKEEQKACTAKTEELKAVAKESEKKLTEHDKKLKERLKQVKKDSSGDLSKSVEEAKKGLAAQAKKVKEVKDLLSEVTGKVSAAKTRVSSAEHKIDIMKRALKAQDPPKDKREAAEARIAAAVKSLEDVKKTLASLEKRQDSVEKLQSKSTSAYDTLAEELQGLESAKQEVDSLESKLKAIKALSKADQEKAAEFEKTGCSKIADAVKKLEASVKTTKEGGSKLEKDIENAKKELATAQAETIKYRKAASNLKLSRKEVLSVSARLKTFTESKFDTIVAEVKKLTDKQKELEGSLKESSADVAKAKAAKEKAGKAAKQAQEKLDKELEKAQKDVDSARKALQEASKMNSETSETLRKAKASRVAAEKKYAVVAERIKEMEAAFKKSDKKREAELARLKKSEEAMKAELQKMKEKKKGLKDDLKLRWGGMMF